jgi:thioredoxin 1
MTITEINNDSEFNEIINEYKLVFVDYYTDTCGPCISFVPKLKVLSDMYPTVKFLKVNITKLQVSSTSKGIISVPTFRLFENGKMLNEVIGANYLKVKYILDTITTT